jgi:hypothetical protein
MVYDLYAVLTHLQAKLIIVCRIIREEDAATLLRP